MEPGRTPLTVDHILEELKIRKRIYLDAETSLTNEDKGKITEIKRLIKWIETTKKVGL